MSLWMMAEPEVLALYERYEKAQASGQKPMVMQDGIVRGESKNILQMRGPLIARSDFITEMFGLRTTEQLMDDFQELVAEGKPILLDIDGPGGQVPLIFEFADMIHAAGDQVTSYTGGIAASAHMALHQAANTRLAHDTATLGSIGVISFVPFKFDDEVVSSNAKNKIPSKERQQERANELEAIFHARLTEYTGMSAEDIVSKGEEGGVFTGQSALDKGFVDSLSNSQDARDRVSTNSNGTNSMTPEEEKATREDERALADERWELLLAHDNSGNHDALSEIAKMPISNDQALAMMKHVSVPAPADNAADKGQSEGEKEQKTESAQSIDPVAMGNAIAESLRASMSSGELVESAKGKEEDEGEDDAKKPADEVAAGEAFALQMLNRGVRK